MGPSLSQNPTSPCGWAKKLVAHTGCFGRYTALDHVTLVGYVAQELKDLYARERQQICQHFHKYATDHNKYEEMFETAGRGDLTARQRGEACEVRIVQNWFRTLDAYMERYDTDSKPTYSSGALSSPHPPCEGYCLFLW